MRLPHISHRTLSGLARGAFALALLVAGLVFVTQSRLLAVQTAPPSAPVSGGSAGVPLGLSLDAYQGLGTWIDIFDDGAYANPSAAVANMASHGVRTLYIETGNSSHPGIYKPAALGVFIEQAHARGMRVVAWNLPYLVNVNADYSNCAAAIRFTTPSGQRFDSFALDIESGKVSPVSARNARLKTLSAKLRACAGPYYALGAIIPSPKGLAKAGSYWPYFPYSWLGQYYDVILPMNYYTYHWKTPADVYTASVANVTYLRSRPGCADVPVHLIGGITNSSSTAMVTAFVKAEGDTKCIGASMYGFPGTTSAMWSQLAAVQPVAVPPWQLHSRK